MSLHYLRLLVEALQPLMVTVSMLRPTKEGMLLTVVAKYHSKE